MQETNKSTETAINRIQRAESELAAAREELVDRGWVSNFESLSPRFLRGLDDLLLSVRDAVRGAEQAGDAAQMRRLLPLLSAAIRLIQHRRELETDRINHPAAKFARFMQTLDTGVIPAVQRLPVLPRAPQIQTVKQMMVEGCGLPAVMGVWRHLGVVLVEQICHGLADDVPAEQHPEVIAWHETQKQMPDYDDSVLYGECRTIERQRQRGNVPAVI